MTVSSLLNFNNARSDQNNIVYVALNTLLACSVNENERILFSAQENENVTVTHSLQVTTDSLNLD